MALRSAAADKDSRFAMDTSRQMLNTLIQWLYYSTRNYLMSTTTATLPAVAIAGTTTKVQIANATVVKCAGAANAVAATDNAFVLTGGVLAASSFRRYLLLVSAADAFTVQASVDASTAAAALFSALPADGLAIVGSILIATDGSHTFTPATTALSATGITTTYYDGFGDDAVFPFTLITP